MTAPLSVLLTLSMITPAGPASQTAAPAPQTAAPAPQTLEPVLVTSVDTRSGGTGARLLLGDVTGDGRLDLVTMQPTWSADDRFIGRQVQALTAYDFGTGQQL